MVQDKDMTRRKAVALAGLGGTVAGSGLIAGSGLMAPRESRAQTKKELRKHPRLAKALESMQDAKKFLEEAPNKFGGYKAKAITALEIAIVDLKLALESND